MSIQIGGTVVIDDSRALQNITNLPSAARLPIAGNGGVPITAVSNTHYLVFGPNSPLITLPASPALGDVIAISAHDTCIIGRNGKSIMGLAEDMTIDGYGSAQLMKTATLKFVQDVVGMGWVLV